MENKTAEEIYESNRPKFYHWGTLKDMCLASMEEYASLQCAELKVEYEKLRNANAILGKGYHDLQAENESLKKLLKESLSAINFVQVAENCENQKLTQSADKAWEKVREFRHKVIAALKV